MKREEARAETYLKSLNLGDVIFEPCGNISPDFKVGRDIAVEVRRLNQSYERGGKLRGLEEDQIPLASKVKKLVHAFRPPDKKEFMLSWFLSFQIRRRPIDPWRDIAKQLNSFLLRFAEGDESCRGVRLSRSIYVSLTPASTKLDSFFRLGGWSDFDAGGWVIPELIKNINFCVGAKATALNSLSGYRERWLLLVDHIGFGHKEEFSIALGGWDRLILLAPEGKLTAYEPSALSDV